MVATTLSRAAFVAALLIGSNAAAATIDFETIPGDVPVEGLTISNQFQASEGIVFSLGTGGSPVLAEIGTPRTAFVGFGGGDNVRPDENVGRFFLTDDGTNTPSPSTLIVTYDTATRAASAEILDIDFDESYTITLFDAQVGGSVLDTFTISAGDPDTGNGVATNFSFSRPVADVLRIEFTGSRQASGLFGLGFDNFNATSAAIPLPAGLPLLLTALAGVALVGRRKNA